jgi:hypothetical protein
MDYKKAHEDICIAMSLLYLERSKAVDMVENEHMNRNKLKYFCIPTVAAQNAIMAFSWAVRATHGPVTSVTGYNCRHSYTYESYKPNINQ